MKENVFIVPEGTKVITRGTIPRDVTKVVIPDTVIEIRDEAFDSCKDLTEISIPNSVIEIGVCAFYHCKSLTKVVIPDSAITLGNGMFDGCTSLIGFISKNFH